MNNLYISYYLLISFISLNLISSNTYIIVVNKLLNPILAKSLKIKGNMLFLVIGGIRYESKKEPVLY